MEEVIVLNDDEVIEDLNCLKSDLNLEYGEVIRKLLKFKEELYKDSLEEISD